MKNKLKDSIYIRMLPYLYPYKTKLWIYLGLSIFTTLLGLLTPWPMKILVDNVVGDHPLPNIVNSIYETTIINNKIMLLILVVVSGITLSIIINLLQVYNSTISINIRQKIVLDLKSRLFYHLQKQSFTFHDSRRIGDLIYRINNDSWGIDEIILTVMPLLVASITLIGMFCVMISLNWQLGLLSLMIIPFFYGSYGYYSKHFEKRVDEVQRMEGESLSIIQEVLSALRIVKAFTREEHEHSRFMQQGGTAVKARINLTKQQMIYSMIVSLMTMIGTSMITGVGVYQILRGSLTLGGLFVILAYLSSVYGPLESISSAATYINGYLAKMKRIFEILDNEPDIKDTTNAISLTHIKGQVEFEGVGFAYHSGESVLHDINLRVSPGQVIGIAGPTGAGKTTLVSLIPRFYDSNSGRILIDGYDIREIAIKSLRQQISIVMQEAILFQGTIEENIRYGRLNATCEEIMQAAKFANADGFISNLPNGYHTQIGERGVKLSGGERQRISIARAFLKDAPILILDEPTSALDARTEFLLLDAMNRLMNNRTTFIIAHRFSAIKKADWILVIDHGKIVEQGLHSELVALGGLYASLYEYQANTTNDDAREIDSRAL